MILDQSTVELFAEHLRSRGKQPATVESYCRDAAGFVHYLQANRVPLDQVEPATLLAYQEHLRSDLTERDNSIRRAVIGIRQFFRFLRDSSRVKVSPFDDVPIPQRDDSIRLGLNGEDIERLIAAAISGSPSCKAARDSALLAFLAFEGIKANELIALQWRDLLADPVGAYLHIGGSRARTIRLSPRTAELVANYQKAFRDLRHPSLDEAKKNLMFIAFKGRDASLPLPNMTRHGLKFIIYELGGKVGIDSLNTEQLRHFAVSHLISLGNAPDQIMGHLGLRRLGNIAKHLATAGAMGSSLVKHTSDLGMNNQ